MDGILEKPSPDEVTSRHAVVGRYILSHKILDVLQDQKPGKAGEIQLTDAIKLLLNIIGERCEYNINNCKMVDIKDIFINARYDNMIDFIVDYKIFNSNKIYGTEGWGIEYNINNL